MPFRGLSRINVLCHFCLQRCSRFAVIKSHVPYLIGIKALLTDVFMRVYNDGMVG